MTGNQLRYIKQQMKFGTCDMYRTLELPRRTYQDYESGRRTIPPEVARRVLATYRADRRWMRDMDRRIDEALMGNNVPNEATVEEDW